MILKSIPYDDKNVRDVTVFSYDIDNNIEICVSNVITNDFIIMVAVRISQIVFLNSLSCHKI